jgi:hypothetical protein
MAQAIVCHNGCSATDYVTFARLLGFGADDRSFSEIHDERSLTDHEIAFIYADPFAADDLSRGLKPFFSFSTISSGRPSSQILDQLQTSMDMPRICLLGSNLMVILSQCHALFG